LTPINARRPRSTHAVPAVFWLRHGGIMARQKSRTWALAINSSRSRILRGLSLGDEEAPAELVMRSEARNLRDIMSDKPGRSFAAAGGGRRSAMEYSSDLIAEDQRDFVRLVLAVLESHRRAGEFDRLAIFAEHDILGHMRQLMPPALREMVICEIPKNLLHLSAQELPEVISRELKDGLHLS
jgi:protein required for attachment to host cells